MISGIASGGGKPFFRKAVDVSGSARDHASNVCLAITNCWISLAPS